MDNYINNIDKNKHDYGIGVKLPMVIINNQEYLIGLKYEEIGEITKNCRNLYKNNEQDKMLVGVIKYNVSEKIVLENDFIKNDYELYLNDFDL